MNTYGILLVQTLNEVPKKQEEKIIQMRNSIF